MKMFDGKFDAAMNLLIAAKRKLTVDVIHEQVETVLGLMDVVESDDEGLFMLCAISSPGEKFSLLKTERKAVSNVDLFDYVGAGDSSVVRYLSPLLTQLRRCTVTQALNIGTYIVRQAKRYVEGCGGDTDAILMRGDIPLTMFGVGSRELMLELAEFGMGIAACSFFDTRDSDQQFKERTKKVAKMMNDTRPEFMEDDLVTAITKPRLQPRLKK